MDTKLKSWLQSLHRLPVDLHCTALQAEASHRRFYRVLDAEQSWIVMHSPPELENNTQFERLADCFGNAGLGVPHILDSNPQNGFYLMTDLGSTHLLDVYGTDRADSALDAAVDGLAELQKVHDEHIPAYTAERLYMELGIFREWFLKAWLGVPEHPELAALEITLVEEIMRQPVVCVHRDFHCRNLLIQSNGTLGIVDFQDALMGPALYDIATLLRDCYYTLDDAQIERSFARFLAVSSHEFRTDPAQLRDLTAIQRDLKAIGIFARLCLRDSKYTHLKHIAPVMGQIANMSGTVPGAGFFKDWFETLLPLHNQRLGAKAT